MQQRRRFYERYVRFEAEWSGKSMVNNVSFIHIKANLQIITNEGICLDSLFNEETITKGSALMVRIVACQTTVRQKWHWEVRTQQLQLEAHRDVCVTAGDGTAGERSRLDVELNDGNSGAEARFNVSLVQCARSLPQQQRWLLLPMPWKS